VTEFAATFGNAWPNLVLVAAAAPAVPGPGPPLPAAAPPAAHRGPPRLSFDRDLLRQVLVNLCDNSSQALAAANDGAAARGTVTFTLALDGRPGRGGAAVRQASASSPVAALVALEVADDGPGIPAAVLPRLFEPYATTRRVGEGMGLGLAISRKILLDHGGDLELARTSAAGSVFRLLLPSDQEAW